MTQIDKESEDKSAKQDQESGLVGKVSAGVFAMGASVAIIGAISGASGIAVGGACVVALMVPAVNLLRSSSIRRSRAQRGAVNVGNVDEELIKRIMNPPKKMKM